MIRTLLRIVGLLVALAALPATWLGLEAANDCHQLDNQISTLEAQAGVRMPKEQADKQIAECRQEIEQKTTERNLWFGMAAGALVVGLTTALLPSGRKRKAATPTPAPAPDPDVSAP